MSVTSRASVVIVVHNSADVLGESLAAIPADAEILIVDNASADGWRDVLNETRREVTVVALNANRGFAAGCNIGASSANRQILVFLNPDATLQAGALELLVERVANRPKDVVGPALLDLERRVRLIARRRSCLRQDAADLIPGARRIMPERWRRDISGHNRLYAVGGTVDYLQGACLAISRETFEAIGGFDEEFFLYYEEEELCDRVRRAGGRCIYEPRATVVHAWGTSSRKAYIRSTRHRFRSRVVLERKRRGRGRAFLAGAMIAVLVPVRVLASPIAAARRSRPICGPLWGAAALIGVASGVTARGSDARSLRERPPVGVRSSETA